MSSFGTLNPLQDEAKCKSLICLHIRFFNVVTQMSIVGCWPRGHWMNGMVSQTLQLFILTWEWDFSDPVFVVYRCKSLSSSKDDCSTCHYYNQSEGYECHWCKNTGCVVIDDSRCPSRETCGRPIVTKVSSIKMRTILFIFSFFPWGGGGSKLDSQTPVPHALCTVYILHWMLLRFMDITDGICNDTYFRETLHVYIFMVRTLYGFPFGKHVSLSILNTRSEKGVKGVQFKYW